MNVIALSAFQDNYIWIMNQAPQEFICVDPGDATSVLAYAAQHNLTLTHIMLTHHHHDHIGGVPILLEHFPNCHVHAPNDIRFKSLCNLSPLTNPLIINSISFQILDTPGHTSTHICYYEPQHHWLFCGDTLFSVGCGRVFDGTMDALFQSLQVLKTLPNDTKIYCAHEYTADNLRFAATIEPNNVQIQTHSEQLKNHPNASSLPSTLAFEKKVNPFLRTDTPAIQSFALKIGVNPQDEFAIFKAIRELKDQFS
jgi:hydroxyacylglutathione hydrolase